MSISASRVTRFGIGGGIWRPAGDFSTKEENVAAVFPRIIRNKISVDKLSIHMPGSSTPWPNTSNLDDNWSEVVLGNGQTLTYSGTNSGTATCSLSAAAGRSYISTGTNIDLKAGRTYAFSVEVVSFTSLGGSPNSRMFLANADSSSGSENITLNNVKSGGVGRYATIWTNNSTETVSFSLGIGANANENDITELVIREPMLQDITEWGTTEFDEYTPYANRSLLIAPPGTESSGLVTFSEGASSTETIPYFTTTLCIGDSFSNDFADFPVELDELLAPDGVNGAKGSSLVVSDGSGQNSTQQVARIQDDLDNALWDAPFDGVVFQGSVDSIHGGAAEYAAMLDNVKAARQLAVDNGCGFIVVGLTPYKNAASWTADRQTKLDAYQAELAAYAVDTSVTFVDVYALLEDAADELDATYDSGDGLHPNNAGSIVIAQAIYDAICAYVHADIVVDDATTGGGKSKWRNRHYPRWVMINGQRYRVNSPEEERQLLEAVRDRAIQEEQVAETPVEVQKAYSKRIRIEKRIEKIPDVAEQWLARLREEDEELLIILH